MNITHQPKKMDVAELKTFATASRFPIPDEQIAELPLYRPAEDSVEMQYLTGAPRGAGRLPARSAAAARHR